MHESPVLIEVCARGGMELETAGNCRIFRVREAVFAVEFGKRLCSADLQRTLEIVYADPTWRPLHAILFVQGSDFQGADKDVLTFYMRARTRTLPVEIGVIVDGLVKRAALRSVALAYRAFTKRHLQGYKTLPEALHGVCQAVEADARNVI